MITLQSPPSAARPAQAATSGQTNPASPVADSSPDAAEPLLFALLLAQQSEAPLTNTIKATSTGNAEDEAATAKDASPGDPAPAPPWFWLGLPSSRDAATTMKKIGSGNEPSVAIEDPRAPLVRADGADKTALIDAKVASGDSPSAALRTSQEKITEIQATIEPPVRANAGDISSITVQTQQGTSAQRPAAVPAEIPIDSQIGTPRWTRDIHQSVSMLVQSRTSVAELRLTPADMGPIQIRIDFSDTQPSVLISVQQADTRNALDAALPRLRDMLAESGVTLGGASVEQNNRHSDDASGDPARFSGQRRDHDPITTVADEPMVAARTISLDQLVDTYA